MNMFWPTYRRLTSFIPIPTTWFENLHGAQRLSTYEHHRTEYGWEASAIFDIPGYKHLCGATFNEYSGRGKTKVDAIKNCHFMVRQDADMYKKMKKALEQEVAVSCL